MWPVKRRRQWRAMHGVPAENVLRADRRRSNQVGLDLPLHRRTSVTLHPCPRDFATNRQRLKSLPQRLDLDRLFVGSLPTPALSSGEPLGDLLDDILAVAVNNRCEVFWKRFKCAYRREALPSCCSWSQHMVPCSLGWWATCRQRRARRCGAPRPRNGLAAASRHSWVTAPLLPLRYASAASIPPGL
jgi:hypothetical protein